MKSLKLALFVLSAALVAGAQVYSISPPPITSSGGTVTVPNFYGAMNITFEEVPSGSPGTVSITVQGCEKGGTCDAAMDTNTSTSAAIRSVTPTAKVYGYFLVTASWTGGTSVSIQVNPVLTTARAGGGGSGTANALLFGGTTQILGNTAPTLNQCLLYNGTNIVGGSCSTGAGTVTSVGLSVPASLFAVSGSPVTGSGNLTATFQSIAAHLFLGNNTGISATAALVRPACGDLSDSSGGCSMSTASGGDLSGTLPSPSVVDLHFGATQIPLGTAPGSGNCLFYNGTNITGTSCGSGSGTVTTFSAGNLAPLFTSSVATPTTTPSLTFSLTNAGGNTLFGNNSASSGAPSYFAPSGDVALSAGALNVTAFDFSGTHLNLGTAPGSGQCLEYNGTTITGAACSGGSMVFPSGSGFAIVSGGTSWGTTLADPLPAGHGGTGVSNTATLTLGTSNVNLATLGTGLVKNTTTTGALTNAAASDVVALLQGLTGCNTVSNVFTPQASDCVAPSSSGTVNSGTQNAFAYYATSTAAVSSGPAPPTVNGQYLCGYQVVAGVSVAPTCPLVGFKGRAVTGATSTDTILYSDAGFPVNYQGSAAVAVTLPTATTLGNSGFGTILTNTTSGSSTAVTVTPTTWTVNGSSSLAIAQGQGCKFYVDASGTNWDADCHDLPLTGGTNITIARGQYGPTINGPSALPPNGSATGDLSGSYPNPTVAQVNGAVVPVSATALASNASRQLIAATVQGNGTKVQLSTGTTTLNDCVKFDTNGNTVDAGAACGTSGGVTSFTGDTVVLSNSGSTGAVTATLANAAVGTVLGNATSAAAVPTYHTLSAINPQTATYQVLATDFSAYKTISVASGTFTITLVASGSQPTAGQYINVLNYGSGVVTIARSGQNINGAAANFTLGAGSASAPTSTQVWSDGTNYFAQIDEGTVGTVTSVAQTVPSWLTVGGSPITTSGTLAITATTGQTSHQVIGTCGAATTFAPCALVNGDLPAITLDKSASGLANPTADSTFTWPIGSTVGITLNGTAPASVSTATGTNGSSVFVVTAPTGGADSNATGTAGVGGSPAITAGAGGAGTGTNAVGGAGGSVTLTAANGGASLGTGANANGGNIVLTPGAAGSGGSGTAGKYGSVVVGGGPATAIVAATGGGNMAGEGTAPTGVSANDAWYANSTNHCFDLINQTTDIGCALGNNGTNTAGASMTLDMSAATGATALKVPVIAGATAGANGVVDYDSTNNNTHIRTNGADSLAVGEAAAVGANIILKATDGTHSLATASSISDGVTAGLTSTANMLKGGNTVRLTANATAITATTPGTTVLTFGALPVSTNFSFHCSILYNQQTAAVAGTGFAIQGATNAPTRLDAWGSMFTSNAGAAAEGVLQNLASTTATSVVTGTPSAITTVFQAMLDGSIQVGASASTLNILAFTGNASDSITIQAGSYCTLTP